MLTRRNLIILISLLALFVMATGAIAQDAPPTAVPEPTAVPPIDAPPTEPEPTSAYLKTLESLTNLIAVLGLGMLGLGATSTAGSALLLRTLFQFAALIASLTPTDADDKFVEKGRITLFPNDTPKPK